MFSCNVAELEDLQALSTPRLFRLVANSLRQRGRSRRPLQFFLSEQNESAESRSLPTESRETKGMQRPNAIARHATVDLRTVGCNQWLESVRLDRGLTIDLTIKLPICRAASGLRHRQRRQVYIVLLWRMRKKRSDELIRILQGLTLALAVRRLSRSLLAPAPAPAKSKTDDHL